MALKPHAEAAQAPQAEIDVLRSWTKPKLVMSSGDGWSGLCIRRDGAEHGVGMTDKKLGRSLDRHIGAMSEGFEKERRRPGVVDDHDRARLMRSLGDRRNVLHLESLRAWGFGE